MQSPPPTRQRPECQVTVASKDLFTALRSEWAELSRDAAIDERTGLGNSRAFERDWAERHAQRHSYGLVLVDVDHFHSYNRFHGMRAGDETLKAIASAMVDVAGDVGRLYRYGGEEFVAIVEATGFDADTVGRAIVDAVRELDRRHGDRPDGRHHVTVTAAGVTVDPDRDDRLAVFDRVDRAMIAGKAAGRDRYVTTADTLESPL